MHHEPALIATIAAAFGLALILGFVALRLRLPALVGYMIAGVILGPATPGFVADVELSQQLAEIGVMLLMFGVGLHFSLADLLAVRRIALPGAVAQIAAATALGAAVAHGWGWSLGAGLVFGLALSVASTVVLLRALESRGLLDSINGRIAVGWLVVEDLVMVLVLVLLPPLAGWLGGTAADGASQGDVLRSFLFTIGKVAAFVVLMLAVGKRIFPWLLWQVARTGSQELFTLCVIAAAVTIAWGAAAVFGVSFALGAFFAGTVLRESALSHRAADETLPLRDAFSVLFFVSVGMLFDPRMLFDEPLRVLAVVAIVLLGKSLAAFVIVLAFRYPLNTALTVSASLAQIGEFSFILAALGIDLGLLSPEGRDLILAGAILSIFLNPLAFVAIDRLKPWLDRRTAGTEPAGGEGADPAASPPVIPITTLTNHAVVVGHGRVGSQVAAGLRDAGQAVLVIEDQDAHVETARAAGHEVIVANAAHPAAILAANLGAARWLFVAIPNAFEAGQVVLQARQISAALPIVVRGHYEEEVEHLNKQGASMVIMGEHELARGMLARTVSAAAGATPDAPPPAAPGVASA